MPGTNSCVVVENGTAQQKLSDPLPYKIIKQKFLNYRQFNFKLIKGKKEVIPAYALSYSTLPRKRAQGRIEFEDNNVHYFNREEVKFITLEHFNSFLNKKYHTINELIFQAPTFDEELQIRSSLLGTHYDLTPIIVVATILDSKLTISLDAKTYEDVKEKIIIL